MSLITKIINERREFSKEKIISLEKELAEIEILNKYKDLCIYVTGSYGRLEATSFSDIDLFFINKGKESDKEITRISKTLIDSDLIRLAEQLGFPQFSNDGEFLKIHYMEDMKDHLGSPNDDYSNFFTARLLLLLESSPLLNREKYDLYVKEIIDTYYRDFHDHTNFLPIFLVNDIIRYWKTLCLNYEHKRNRPIDDEQKKLKTLVKNLKLIFSRKLTCYSLITAIVSKQNDLSAEDVLELVNQTPIERLENIANEHADQVETIKNIFTHYSWFIDLNNKSENDLLSWISNQENRKIAFGRGKNEFGDEIFKLLINLAEKKRSDILKYLVI